MRDKRREISWISAISLFLILVVIPVTSFAVPGTINYQGYLTDAGGQPLNTTKNITFTIYPSGGSNWAETQSVEVVNGIFSVILGDITSIDPAVFQYDCELGVQVEGDPEMTPRQKLTSAPFAINAETLDGISSEEFIDTENGGIISGSSTSGLLTVTNSDGSGHAMYGENSSSANYGYLGGSTYGVYGEYGSENPSYPGLRSYGFIGGEVDDDGFNNFAGIYGYGAPGVLGKHMGSGNYAKLGLSTAAVFGKNIITQNRGGIGGSQVGAWGFANDETGVGVKGVNLTSGSEGRLGTYIIGVTGDGNYEGTLGVQGVYHPHGVGKENIGSLGHEFYGVEGAAFSDNGQGVFGIHQGSGNNGSLGHEFYGVVGNAYSDSGLGIFGIHHPEGYWGALGTKNNAGEFNGNVVVNNGNLAVNNGNVDADGFTINGVPIGLGSPEQLKIIRGTIASNGSIVSGSGFSCVHPSVGKYTINFTTSFTSAPSVVVSARGSTDYGDGNPWFNVANVQSVAASSFTVWTRTQQQGATYDPKDNGVDHWDFIATGPM